MTKSDTLIENLVEVVTIWIEENDISVRNQERKRRILWNHSLTHEDVPILFGSIGEDLKNKLRAALSDT